MQNLELDFTHAENLKKYFGKIDNKIKGQGVVINCSKDENPKNIHYDFIYELVDCRVNDITEFIKNSVEQQFKGVLNNIFLLGDSVLLYNFEEKLKVSFNLPIGGKSGWSSRKETSISVPILIALFKLKRPPHVSAVPFRRGMPSPTFLPVFVEKNGSTTFSAVSLSMPFPSSDIFRDSLFFFSFFSIETRIFFAPADLELAVMSVIWAQISSIILDSSFAHFA